MNKYNRERGYYDDILHLNSSRVEMIPDINGFPSSLQIIFDREPKELQAGAI